MMRWRMVEDHSELSLAAARLMLDAIHDRPDIVLGLPTGKTPQMMYERVTRECQRSGDCFENVTTFNLDEYVGIGPNDSGSYATYMRRHLFDHIDIDPRRIHIPDGTAAAVIEQNPGYSREQALVAECARYEHAILDAGGLELTFLGMGRNGHIGFNEPGAPFDSRTRVVDLDESTRKANAVYFPDGQVPNQAITMGIKTILASQRIILMASGEGKAPAVRTLLMSEPSAHFPASALKSHQDVLILVDRAAAGEIDPAQLDERIRANDR